MRVKDGQLSQISKVERSEAHLEVSDGGGHGARIL